MVWAKGREGEQLLKKKGKAVAAAASAVESLSRVKDVQRSGKEREKDKEV